MNIVFYAMLAFTIAMWVSLFSGSNIAWGIFAVLTVITQIILLVYIVNN